MGEILVALGRIAGARVKGLRVRSVTRGALAAVVVLLSVPMGHAQKTTAPSASPETSAPSALPAGLPDVLTMDDGAKVTTPAAWAERRAELLKFFTHQMYGVAPPRPAKMRFVVADDTHNALGGIATRKQITILLNGTAHGPALHVLLYIPNHVKRPAVFVGLNFWGNETINADPGIFLPTAYTEATTGYSMNTGPCLDGHRATDRCRGMAHEKWPLAMILKRGYAVATVFRSEVDPDYIGSFKDSVKAYYPELQNRPDNFSTIGAWAWSLSRVLDYLETDHDVDASRVAVFGWSRLGKAALWAAATDRRFALAISNDSGAGGAKLFRRDKGETIQDLNKVFPYWFCGNFKKYNGQDKTLPFDQHMLIALIAPRPVYIADAIDDHWADPEGEFLSGVAASPVFKLLGGEGMPTTQWPPVDHPVMGQMGYHVRTGGHDITRYDWEQYVTFADMHLKRK